MASADVTTEELRPLLFSLAYRMVGGIGDAEDLVQEAFLRLHRERERVEAPKAFLTTVLTRLAIDHLRSARVRRERYVGPWLPEPLVGEPGPDERVEQDETLSLAFRACGSRPPWSGGSRGSSPRCWRRCRSTPSGPARRRARDCRSCCPPSGRVSPPWSLKRF
jgi:hypothetical protein